jgi:hypothetical protein
MPLNRIPKIIYICDKTLEYIREFSKIWKKLNPDYTIELFDDNRCRMFLKAYYPPLVLHIFNLIPKGPIKADLWRICVLLKNGGIYVDADIEPIVPLCEYLDSNADFVTCRAYSKNPKRNFNPNLIVSQKNNPILRKALLWYINKFNTAIKQKRKFEYWDWSIMECFTYIMPPRIRHKPLDQKEEPLYTLLLFNNLKLQLIREVQGKNHYDDHNVVNGVRVFNNRYKEWNFKTHRFETLQKTEETDYDYFS